MNNFSISEFSVGDKVYVVLDTVRELKFIKEDLAFFAKLESYEARACFSNHIEHLRKLEKAYEKLPQPLARVPGKLTYQTWGRYHVLLQFDNEPVITFVDLVWHYPGDAQKYIDLVTETDSNNLPKD